MGIFEADCAGLRRLEELKGLSMKENERGMAPKISVIIPVYNVAPYVSDCLDSLIAQTLEDWEAVCIDDGSEDTSWELLNAYAAKDERIRIFHQENHGVGFARNRAISLAQGEYLFFLDPDDWVADGQVFHDLYTAATEHKVLICGGSFREIRGSCIVTDWRDTKNSKYVFDSDRFMRYAEYQFDYGWVRFLYNREFIVSNKLLIPEYSFYEDPVFFVKAMDRAQSFYALKRTVYCYRMGHKPRVFSLQKVLDLITAMIEIIQLAKREGYFDLIDLETRRILEDYSGDILPFLNTDDCEDIHNKLELLSGLLYSDKHMLQDKIMKVQINNLLSQIEELKVSKDYRLGQRLLRLPRAVKRLLQKLQQTGRAGYQNRRIS